MREAETRDDTAKRLAVQPVGRGWRGRKIPALKAGSFGAAKRGEAERGSRGNKKTFYFTAARAARGLVAPVRRSRSGPRGAAAGAA